METIQEVFLKAVTTAEEMSRQCIHLLRSKRFEAALDVLDNRGRVVNIILHLDEQIRLDPEAKFEEDDDNQVTRLIKSINEKDAVIFELLNQEKLLTQNEIAKTNKNKENFKGYNLKDLK